MTTNTPLMRAAEAAKKALLEDPETDAYMRADDDVDEFLIDGRVDLTRVVRAVLKAIREPSEAVADAGMGLLTERGCNPLTGDAEAVWQAMIDAALSE